VEAFCQEMTVKARELGLSDTAFQTPNGLDANGHYTTAAELCKIGAYAIQNQDFLEITNTSSYAFTELTKGAQKQVSNKNAFLTMYDGAIGIKTGYTSKASYCFVGAVKRDGITLVSAVLASGWYPKKTYKWSDTRQLMDYGYNHYKSVKLLNPSAAVATVAVRQGIETDVTVGVQESVTTLLKSTDRISYEFDLRQELTAPVSKDYVAGTLNIKINGAIYKKVALYTQESANAWNPRWVFRVTLLKFISNF
jgi:D-alanyl-D-alanine carboxypeptidase (penicillin-binding protein 5/6)